MGIRISATTRYSRRAADPRASISWTTDAFASSRRNSSAAWLIFTTACSDKTPISSYTPMRHERDPAREHLRRHEVVEVAPVLVHAERLRARRLPEAVVLAEADTVPAGDLASEPAAALGQHLGRDRRVRLPAVADLACPVLGVASGEPVDLVGPDPRCPFAAEERLEALAQAVDGLRVDELVDDDEAVAVELLPLLVGPGFDHSQPSPSEISRTAERSGSTAVRIALRPNRDAGPWSPTTPARSPSASKTGAAIALRSSSRSPAASA